MCCSTMFSSIICIENSTKYSQAKLSDGKLNVLHAFVHTDVNVKPKAPVV